MDKKIMEAQLMLNSVFDRITYNSSLVQKWLIRKKSNKKKYQKLLERVQRLEAWQNSFERNALKYDRRFRNSLNPKRPKTIVLVYFPDGKESAYHFHSEPDYERIRGEMIVDGAFSVLVINSDSCLSILKDTEFRKTFPRSELKRFVKAMRQRVQALSKGN